MIKIERLRFRHIWSMMTRSIHECRHVRTNKRERTNICKKSVFVVSVRNINICGRIFTQFTGLLRTNTVAAKRDLLAQRTGLGKSVSVSLRKNGLTHFEEQTCSTDYHTVFGCAEEGQISGFDPLPRKIRCRSGRKKAQILKMSTSRQRYVEIPGNSVSVSLR